MVLALIRETVLEMGNKTKPTTTEQTTVIQVKLLCCPLAKRTILAALEHNAFLLTWFPYL